MKPNINYIPLLMTYDVVGPKIANNLKYDYNRERHFRETVMNFLADG